MEKQLYNPIKGTGFEALLDAHQSNQVCQKSLIRTISKVSSRVTQLSTVECPELAKVFKNKLFDYSQMAESVKAQLPAQVGRVEAHFGRPLNGETIDQLFLQMDEYISYNYEGGVDTCMLDLYNDMLLLSSSILAHDLDTSEENGSGSSIFNSK